MTHDFAKFPTENLDFEHPNAPHVMQRHGAPTGARWNGQTPSQPFSQQRVRGVFDRRQYDAAIARGLPLHDEAMFVPGARVVELEDRVRFADLVGAITDSQLRLVREPHRRVLRRVATSYLELGGCGAVLKREHVAAIAGCSERQARRVMGELVELGLLVRVAPLYERHGAASSPRGWAYYLCGAVLGEIARTGTKKGPESGTVRVPENTDVSGSEIPAPPDLSVSSASPRRIDFVRAVPDARTDEPCPVRRQDATRTPDPEANQGSRSRELRAVWRELAEQGDEHARELLDADERAAARLRAYGRGGES